MRWILDLVYDLPESPRLPGTVLYSKIRAGAPFDAVFFQIFTDAFHNSLLMADLYVCTVPAKNGYGSGISVHPDQIPVF